VFEHLEIEMLAYIWILVNPDQPYLSEFGEVLLFIIGGGVFVAITLFVSRLVRPDRPGIEKLTAYESGEEPIGPAWTQFNVRFYIIALIFLLFEVELIFLFPWATVFANKQLIEETNGLWGWFAVTEAVIFILVLALGLAYAWVHGYLDWIKPDPKPTPHDSPVPKEYYQKINQQYAGRQSVKKEI
jgi:NADH-quinone oxidoreductase subunit A